MRPVSPAPPAGLRVENQRTCGHQVPRSEGVTHPPATGEKRGVQDTARTQTAGKELPGRTAEGGREEQAAVSECTRVGEAQPFRMN